LAEETLEASVVEKRRGKVVIHMRVESYPAESAAQLGHDDVVVERITKDEEVTERREPWREDGALMIPVYKEMLVTETRLVLQEVVRVQRRQRLEQVSVEAEVRRDVVDIETVQE
jgi:stress response protein YsnF